MKFFENLGKVLVKNMAYTITLVVAVILFLYFTEFDLIGGILTAVSALIAYLMITLLYQEYKKMYAQKPVAVKTVVAKKPAKKATKKK